jgi:hypothetical protein
MTSEIGLLVDLTEILTLINKLKPVDANGNNNFVYYYSPVFSSTKIIDNIPTIELKNEREYILFELTIPSEEFLNNINLINITPYFFTYNSIQVFASTDNSIEFFKYKFSVGDAIKIIFTSSKTIGDEYCKKGYLVSKIPAEYLLETTFNILLRIGNLYSTYKPEELITSSRITLNEYPLINNLEPYNSLEIINSLPKALNSSLVYSNNIVLLNKLLDTYTNTKQKFINLGYTEIITYLYLQNIPNPPVNYAFTSFYDSIKVTHPVNLLGNNTGECYFNSEIINLSQYINKEIIIVAVNQNLYGFGVNSTIQIYNNDNLNVITNGSYLTSPQIPSLNSYNYPYINHDDKCGDNIKYPIINIQTFNVNTLISNNINIINISERVSYNPINFSYSDYYLVPKFSIFITN